ncbi:MAG: MFS transporter, partial [Thermoproteota archaeon]
TSGYVSIAYGLRNALLVTLFLSLVSVLSLLFTGSVETSVKEEEQSEWNRSHRPVLIPYLVAHISKLSDTLMWGVLPLSLLVRGGSLVGIGHVQSAIMFTFALFTILMGKLSDRLGRKISVIIGISMNIVGISGCFVESAAMDPSVLGMIFGIGTAMFYPVLPAMISDSIPEGLRGRYLGICRGVRDLGYFSGVILLGLLLDNFGELVTLAFIITLLMSSMVLSAIYLRETRPVWSTYLLHLKHVEILEESLVEFRDFIRELTTGNYESCKKHASRFKELERSMDDLKYRVESEIWRSVVDRDRADMIRIVSRIDRVTMYLLETVSRLLIAWDSVPNIVRPMLLEASERLLRTGTLLKDAARNMKVFPEESLKLIRRVDEEERDYDALHFKQLEELYRCRLNFDPIGATMISEVIESMEYAMDELQEASHLMHSLVSKYFYVKI